MDRLSALVALHVKEELRALSFARERMAGLVFGLSGLLLSSLFLAVLAFLGLRALERASPQYTLTVVAGLACALGLMWALSPLLSGVAFATSHDMSRLLHFPIPLRTLVVSSLVANFLQPMAAAEMPVLLAAALALSGAFWQFPLVALGLLLSFALALAGAQAAGLLVHGLSRNRRLQDVAMFLGLAFGFLMSVLPMLLLIGGGATLRPLVRAGRVLEWLPFAWGARGAVHAGRGELLPFAGFAAAAFGAIVATLLVSSGLIGLIYRGELDLGTAARRGSAGARMRLPGALGALLKKDLRSAWRDPGLRASLLLGLLGPVLVLFFLTRTPLTGRAGSATLLLATFVGLSAFGSNAFGFERRGLGLLFSFPVARWRLLLGKNLTALLFRIPGLLTLTIAAFFTAPLVLAPAALVIAGATFLIAVGADNFYAILFPIAAPAPGRNPYAQASGARGFGTALVSALFLMGVGALSAPFAFLAWLPLLLRTPSLWLATLPLALLGAGADAVYAMLLAGAARLLERREPEVLERVLSES